MLTTLRYIWALLTLASCAAAASITGIVYLRQGETRSPLPNVRVSARSPVNGELLRTAKTAGDGRYQLAGLPPGRTIVSASRPGYYTRVAGKSGDSEILLDCVSGRGYAHNDFERFRGGVISGRVVDELAEPVERIPISLSRANPQKGGGDERVPTRVMTDDRGMFRVAGLEPGIYVVSARQKAGRFSYEADTESVKVRAGRETDGVSITLRRVPLFRVAGAVAGLGTAPDTRIKILLERVPKQGRSLSINAEKDGRFDFHDVPAGRYHLFAHLFEQNAHRSRTLLLRDAIDVQSDITDLIVQPSPSTGVAGAVRVVSGVAPPKFRLTFSSVGGRGSRGIQVMAPDYQFAIRDLPPGSYDIKAAGPEVYLKGIAAGGNLAPPRNVTVSAGGVTRLEILAAADHGRVRGTVRQGGTRSPVPHARVAIDGARGIRSEQADQNGRFLFANVIPGEYRICAWPDIRPELIDHEASWEKAGCAGKIFPVEPNSEVELDLTPAP